MTTQEEELQCQAKQLAEKYFPIIITAAGPLVDARYEPFVLDLMAFADRITRKETR